MVSSNVLEITCRISGEVNSHTITSLKERLSEATKQTPQHIFIDLQKATQLNAQAVEVINAALKVQQTHGGSLSLINLGQLNEAISLETTTLDNGVIVVRLSGKLDLASTNSTEPKFLKLCQGDKRRLLVDLSGMDFISSVGIRMFLQAIKLTSSTSGKLLFLNPSQFAKSALETAGFSQLMAFGTPEEIAAAL